MTYKEHASVSYVQFKGQKTHSRRYDNDIDTENEIVTHHTSLAFYGYAHCSWSHALYIAVTYKLNSHALIVLRNAESTYMDGMRPSFLLIFARLTVSDIVGQRAHAPI